MEISQWTSRVEHISGQANTVADWLSQPENVPGAAYTLDPAMDPAVDGIDDTTTRPTNDTAAPITQVLSTVDHVALAEAQDKCSDVKAYSEGKQERDLKFERV